MAGYIKDTISWFWKKTPQTGYGGNPSGQGSFTPSTSSSSPGPEYQIPGHENEDKENAKEGEEPYSTYIQGRYMPDKVCYVFYKKIKQMLEEEEDRTDRDMLLKLRSLLAWKLHATSFSRAADMCGFYDYVLRDAEFCRYLERERGDPKSFLKEIENCSAQGDDDGDEKDEYKHLDMQHAHAHKSIDKKWIQFMKTLTAISEQTWYLNTSKPAQRRMTLAKKRWTEDVPLYLKYFVEEQKDLLEPFKSELAKVAGDDAVFYSWMSTSFKPAPYIKSFLTPERWALVQRVFRAADEPVPSFPINILHLRNLVTTLERITHTSEIVSWEVRVRNHERKKARNVNKFGALLDKKNTYTAVYQKLRRNERSILSQGLQQGSMYDDAVGILGIIRGRYRNFYAPGIRALAARVDKVGLLQSYVQKQDLDEDLAVTDAEGRSSFDFPSVVFLALCTSEFSVRKGFTLVAQQHGILPPMLSWMLDNILKDSPTTRWDLIASIYPTKWILEKLDPSLMKKMYDDWLGVLDLMMPFILEQWANGVEARVEKDMAVPSAGYYSGHVYFENENPVDSEGWNFVVGAWNNAIRHLRLCAECLNNVNTAGHSVECPAVFKLMKLTAHDQMEWASAVDMGVHKDMEIFKQLIKNDILPWSGLNNEAGVIRKKVEEICDRLGSDVNLWLGKPRERRRGREQQHHDMICGIIVSNASKEQADNLKSAGLFKAKPAHQVKFSPEASASASPESSSPMRSSWETELIEESDGEKSGTSQTSKPVPLKKGGISFAYPGMPRPTDSSHLASSFETVVLTRASHESQSEVPHESQTQASHDSLSQTQASHDSLIDCHETPEFETAQMTMEESQDSQSDSEPSTPSLKRRRSQRLLSKKSK